jgi:hypothetical protein
MKALKMEMLLFFKFMKSPFFSSRNNKGCESFEKCFGNWTLAGCFVK